MLLKTCLPVFLAIAMLTFSSCKKKKKDNPAPNVQEETLAFELPEVQVGKYNMAQDSTYALKVNVTSKLPEKGVKVTLNVATETGLIPLPQDDIADISTTPFTITLRHLKPLKTYEVTIRLASLGNTGNVTPPQVFFLTNKSAE
ncbi:hypothetical protein SAMN05660461_3913 [Chitinophaga ginsengisegetis]|uniref:Uncharacterized protein n=1 Tax=Chitinophaga ginsengisegetis TaxID=393003 RepID=A0A1T5P5H3_9BACT|nr:hypothetical protein [Chitinophaga ginsengisegetis]MDR6566504.1 hypothetical protein [Chitinophaga ginsengisegetis]MDR6646234.1 hypothetical protein [Chitinophaga ginsengisegetis]MDR6651173.1 hypothetical protein [Chitinophaga ginsengisegetis]SKD07962.1 hypothetical protein SAMN05660461_3913 [Chitinophaga ginsengisegetis]